MSKIEITEDMIEAGQEALGIYAESPPRILVEEILRAALNRRKFISPSAKSLERGKKDFA